MLHIALHFVPVGFRRAMNRVKLGKTFVAEFSWRQFHGNFSFFLHGLIFQIWHTGTPLSHQTLVWTWILWTNLHKKQKLPGVVFSITSLLCVSWALILLFCMNFIANSSFLHWDLKTFLNSGKTMNFKPVWRILRNRQCFQETFHVCILIFFHHQQCRRRS